MKTVDWYFDFISPFAYLSSVKLDELPGDIILQPKPILFAGLLKHWNTKGPAEIAPMRQYTFRHVAWLADDAGIALSLPPMHPFNPLKLLRLAILLDADVEAVKDIFRFVWAEGNSSDNESEWIELTSKLNLSNAESQIAAPDVKQALITNTQNAIDAGVFGVPTFAVDGELFYGQDSMEFLKAYLANPGYLQSPHIQAADKLPEGTGRKI